MAKRGLSESDICMKFIDPAIERAGWNLQSQVRRELTFTDGKVIVRGKLWKRGRRKRADYVLFWKKNLPLAIIEAKDNSHSVGAGDGCLPLTGISVAAKKKPTSTNSSAATSST